MKLIQIQLVFLLLISFEAVGCRTGKTVIVNKKERVKIDWQNHLPDNFTKFKEFPLHEAVELGDIDKIRNLLKGGLSIEEKNQFGATPLQLATVSGELEIVKILIKFGANPDGYNFSKQTALHFAALNGFDKIAEELIKSGAKVNPVDDEYWTPLDCALWSGKGIIKIELSQKKQVIDLLIRYGAKRGEIPDH